MKKINLMLLIIFIILAVILNFIPHLNYPYPLHVDEWVHYQYSNHLSDNTPLYFGQAYATNLEAGFHYLLASLNSIGISYLAMFNFFASIITLFICLGAFILTRRIFNETAGVFSVLFLAVLKSSAMILGPVFFVPMAIGLFFILMGLFLIKIESDAWILILASLLIIHPPSALAFVLLINIEFIFIRKNYGKNIVKQAIAGLIALPLYLPIFLNKGIETIENLKFTPIIGLVFIPRYLGFLVILFILAGIYYSAEKKRFNYIAYSVALLFFIFIFYNFKLEVFIPYARALMYLFIIFSVLFGYGCERIMNAANKKIIKIIGILLIVGVLFIGVTEKISSKDNFYNIINDEEYNDLLFIKEYSNNSSIVLADSWISNAITPIAETEVYSRIVQGPSKTYEEKNREIEDFFNNKCKNMELLKENNITLVYDRDEKCENKDLAEIKERIYGVK